MIIHESFQTFINEEETPEQKPEKINTLYQVVFKPDFKLQATEGPTKGEWKESSPTWFLGTQKQATIVKALAPVQSVKGFGEFKDTDTANSFLKTQSEKKEGISGSVSELSKIIATMKEMVRKTDKKTSDEREKEKSTKEKMMYNGIGNAYEGKLTESKVAEYLMDLLEKLYKIPGNKNIMKQIMDMTGINNVKKIEDIIKRSPDAYTAFNNIMTSESIVNGLNEISGDWTGGTLRAPAGFVYQNTMNNNTMPVTNEKLKLLTKKQWDKLSFDERVNKAAMAVDDPDKAEKFAEMEWNELPDWVTSSMYEYKIWESNDVINRDAAIKAARKFGIEIGQKYRAFTKEYGHVDVIVKDIYYWKPTGKLWVDTNQIINKIELPSDEEGQIIFTDEESFKKFKEIKESAETSDIIEESSIKITNRHTDPATIGHVDTELITKLIEQIGSITSYEKTWKAAIKDKKIHEKIIELIAKTIENKPGFSISSLNIG